MRRPLALVLLFVILPACEGGGGPYGGDAVVPCSVQPTLASLEEAYFKPSCALSSSCHTSKANISVDLVLEPGLAYDSIVNVPAQKAPDKMLVVPFDPDASFMVQKVENPGAGEGVLMPFGAVEPIDPGCRIQALRAWIKAGAPRE